VHTHLACATCRRCIDACPRGALALGDDALELDAEACDGCGLCAANCPQEAIAFSPRFDSAGMQEAASWLFACAKADVDRTTPVVPCLHALSWQTLIRLHGRGMRNLAVTSGDCGRCPRGVAANLEERVDQVNALLRSLARDPIALLCLQSEAWRARRTATSSRKTPSPSRRAFLRHLVAPVPDGGEDWPIEALRSPNSVTTVDAVWPAVPTIDADSCNGCDACTRVCRSDALSRHETQERVHFRIDASRCTGCEACVDVCAPNAISIGHWTRAVQRTLDLQTARCPACGVTFHAPSLRADHRCHVCAQTNHFSRLYQRDPV